MFFSPFSIAITSLGEERFSYVCSSCTCLVLSVSLFSWYLGRAAACDCGTPWTFLLPPPPRLFFFFFFFFFFQITISSNEQAFMPIWQKTRSNSIEINIEDHDGTAYLKPTETKASSIFKWCKDLKSRNKRQHSSLHSPKQGYLRHVIKCICTE